MAKTGAEMSRDATHGERISRARPGDEIAPTRYRKKPVEIEAIRWSGTNLKEVIDFTDLNESADKWTWEEYEVVVRERGLKIFSLEGSNFIVTLGDYIIKGVKGEFYACKPDIFWLTYVRADAPRSETVPMTAEEEARIKWANENPKTTLFRGVYSTNDKRQFQALDLSPPSELEESGSMLTEQLRGIAKHLRSVPEYRNLHGDAGIIERAAKSLDALTSPSAIGPSIPDFDGMIDNAAGASQSRELLEDNITRGAVKANVYDPLVKLLKGKA